MVLAAAVLTSLLQAVQVLPVRVMRVVLVAQPTWRAAAAVALARLVPLRLALRAARAALALRRALLARLLPTLAGAAVLATRLALVALAVAELVRRSTETALLVLLILAAAVAAAAGPVAAV